MNLCRACKRVRVLPGIDLCSACDREVNRDLQILDTQRVREDMDAGGWPTADITDYIRSLEGGA